MTARALWTGILLILVSTIAIVASKPTPTAFIPGTLGLLIALLGIVGDKTPTLRRPAMNAALGLATLGILGSLRGVPDFLTLLGGGSVGHPVATMAQFATLFICLGFVVRGAQAFLEARRKP
ncbi:hypothetical protein [Calidithermus timidus]|jgi:hypothetical protein|uniref:hypothetical protein n=1 Tax=Calidithermus timidus TaxID=307124 RepID=UPI00036DA7D8|nr:hypothetical protein [Calidithermus timidus]